MDQEQKLKQTAHLLKTLADYNRLRIVILLSQEGAMNVSAIGTQLAIVQPLLTYHLAKLRDTGILVALRKGRQVYYALGDPALGCIQTLLFDRSANQAEGTPRPEFVGFGLTGSETSNRN